MQKNAGDHNGAHSHRAKRNQRGHAGGFQQNIRREILLGTAAVKNISQPGVAAHLDERAARKPIDRLQGAGARRTRVSIQIAIQKKSGHSTIHTLAVQGLLLHGCRIVYGKSDIQIRFALIERILDLACAALDQIQLHLRIKPMKLRQNIRQHNAAATDGNGYGQIAVAKVLDILHGFFRNALFAEQLFAVLVKAAPCLGQR